MRKIICVSLLLGQHFFGLGQSVFAETDGKLKQSQESPQKGNRKQSTNVQSTQPAKQLAPKSEAAPSAPAAQPSQRTQTRPMFSKPVEPATHDSQTTHRRSAWSPAHSATVKPPYPKKTTQAQNDSKAMDHSVKHGEELVSIDFPNGVSLSDILKTLGMWTGKNFMLSQGVSGSTMISIVSAQPVTKEEAYQVFLSALNIAGLTTVETGKIVKIMTVSSARSANIKTYYGESWAPATDEVINQVVPLHFIDASAVLGQLRSILGTTQVSPFMTTNSLIMTDTGNRIRKILEIIRILDDKDSQAQVSIVPVTYMDAKDAASKVQDIFGSRGGVSLTLQKVLVDDRSNSLILVGPTRGLDEIVRFLDRMDKPASDSASQTASIRVRPLDYADSEKLAATLQALASNSSASAQTFRRPAFASAANRTTGASSAPGAVDLSGVKVTADKVTNSLIIQGSKSSYDEFDQIIKALDHRRAQVYLESDILDIRIKHQLDWNPSFLGGAEVGGSKYKLPFAFNPQTVAPFVAQQSGGGTTTNYSQILNGLNTSNGILGVIGNQKIDIAGVTISPGAFILALKTDTNNNVLQTPSILVTDNDTANLTSGEEYTTIVTSPSASGTSTVTPVKTTVTTSLKVKPQVSHSDFITMNITLNLDDAGPVPPGSTSPASVTKRTADTSVVVQSGQTIAIGGLVTNSTKESEGKVPLLGDIPIIGWLFKSVTRESQKNNLVLFITPNIVRNSDDLTKIYDRKIKERDEFLKLYFGSGYKKEDFYAGLKTHADGKAPSIKETEDSSDSILIQDDEERKKVVPSHEKEKITLPGKQMRSPYPSGGFRFSPSKPAPASKPMTPTSPSQTPTTSNKTSAPNLNGVPKDSENGSANSHQNSPPSSAPPPQTPKPK